MESYIYPVSMIFLLCILPLGIGLIIILAIRGLPLSRRGIETATQMDSATYIKTNEGNLIIKRRTIHIWLIVMFLGIFEIVLLASIISVVSNMIKGEGSSTVIKLGVFLGFFFIGYVLFRTIQALRQPSIIQFNMNSKIIEIGKGSTQEQISFSQVSQITGASHSTPLRGLRRIDLKIILANGNVLELGSISGEKDIARASVIAQQIADATGAKIQDSSGNA